MNGHWLRLVLLLAILASMIAVYAVNDSFYTVLVSLTLVVFPIANWTVFGVVLWTSRQAPEIDSLREKVDDMLTLAISSTAVAAVGALAVIRIIGLINTSIAFVATVGLGYAAVLISVPAISALRTWRIIYLPVIRRRRSPSDGDDGGSTTEGSQTFEHVRVQINEPTTVTLAPIAQPDPDPLYEHDTVPPVAESGS